MKRASFVFIFLAFFAFGVSAQTREARKITDLGYLPCDSLMAFFDKAYQELQKEPEAKLHIIFYRGNPPDSYYLFSANKKPLENTSNFNYALNRAREVVVYLTTHKAVKRTRLVLANGGFREQAMIELWLVPKDAELPKITPTHSRQDFKFSSEIPGRVRNCAETYDHL